MAKAPRIASVDKNVKMMRLEDVSNINHVVTYTDGLFKCFQQSGIGFARPAGDTYARVSFNVNRKIINTNLDTAAVFPVISPNSYQATTIEPMTYDSQIRHSLTSSIMK